MGFNSRLPQFGWDLSCGAAQDRLHATRNAVEGACDVGADNISDAPGLEMLPEAHPRRCMLRQL